ncbi:MAG TPA: PTS sugar transporter subunit IIB [Sporosarcina psychrophila]|uniref:PTS sugar transporter subunit IIB n=1 Tax=Sporosarcina psychrophila TaxID=1476 RepID=A0A921G267_SPOPS|nr:PTS sugar transporter subunit IIB [Sporosarcina psychrophila]
MKTIMLVCSAGMSTSLLVTKMEAAAKAKGEDVKIFAVSEAEANRHYDTIDVLLLGPQVRYLKKKIEKAVEGKNIPVEVIESIDYGTMNGESVLVKALALL